MIFFNLPALLCVGQWWMVVSRFSITKEPMLRDPAEVRLVYVAASSVAGAGEGLWAKTSIMSGQVVALFNGVRQRQFYYEARSAQDWSDYRISCNADLDLDILAEHVSLENYSATLGHKGIHFKLKTF